MIETDITMLPLWGAVYFMLACTLVVPMIAFLCEMAGVVTKKIFLDKLALQSIGLGNITLILSLIATGVLGSIYFQSTLALIKNSLWSQVALASLGLSALFLFTYQATWKKLRQAKAVHILIGCCGTILLKTAFWTGCYAWLEQLKQSNLLTQHPRFWLGLCFWFVLLAATIAFACIGLYLLLRRNKDDFGRDYYRFALSFSLKGALILFLFHFGTYFVAEFSALFPLMTKPVLYVLSLALALAILITFFWQQVAFNTNPISKKSALIIASLALYIFTCSSLLLQANIENEVIPTQVTITDSFSLLQNAP